MNAHRRAALLTAAALSLATLAGCAQTPAPTPTITDAPTVAPMPSASPISVDEATQAATAMMTEYLHTTRSAEEWWQAVKPFLSQQAAYLVKGTSPTRIPTATITETRTLPDATDVSVVVAIDTTRGTYTLTMRRIADDGNTHNAPWLVDEIAYPEGTH